MRASHPDRYLWSGPIYDVISLEWPLYRGPRIAGIDLLRLQPGQTVLDIGCGTGLNFALLAEKVGASGHIVGIDRSSSMLGQAERRARHGWPLLTLWQLDAADLDPGKVRQLTRDDQGVDAVLATYALSVIPGWRRAWRRATEAARPGARAAVVDLGLPAGWAAPLTPLARLACALGGADPHRDPGPVALRGATDRERGRFLGGHVVVDAGTLPELDDC